MEKDRNKKIRIKRGKVIKKRLIDKDMTQRELAKRVGTSEGYMKKIISGERSGATYLEKICEVLEIDDINIRVS